jgi:hypothetical protein
MSASVARIASAAVERARRGEPLGPSALTLLVRQYGAGQESVGDVLGDALAVALDRDRNDRSTMERARWVRAFAEAATISEDSRLADAAGSGIDALSREWPSLEAVDEAAAALDACLSASHAAARLPAIPNAVDALERLVADSYRPGEGVSHTRAAAPRVRGGVSDHVWMASALLTAFELSGRVPYSMLAEELMQASRAALFEPADARIVCEAARVLSRLARLHDDADYRKAAVIAGGADYRADACRLMSRAADQLRPDSDDESLYALTLIELGAGRLEG